VSTARAHEQTVRTCMRDLGLKCALIFNRDALMILPAGVNKATGLDAALAHLSLTRQHVVGIGDAENDDESLRHCGCAVAVANAVPGLSERRLRDVEAEGAGVIEIAQQLLDDDLARIRTSSRR